MESTQTKRKKFIPFHVPGKPVFRFFLIATLLALLGHIALQLKFHDLDSAEIGKRSLFSNGWIFAEEMIALLLLYAAFNYFEQLWNKSLKKKALQVMLIASVAVIIDFAVWSIF